MIIGISGPYSAPTQKERQANLDALNDAAARVLEMGHIPFLGINMALPIIDASEVEDDYMAIMSISLAVTDKCDALLMIGESRGALMERDLVTQKGLPVYTSIDEIPEPEN